MGGLGAALRLAQAFPDGWTIVGGQKVQLLAIENGAAEGQVRATEDVDVLVDVRGDTVSTEQLGRWLTDRQDLDHDGSSPDGIGHRYVRKARTGPGQLIVDVLAPEGLGERADLTTTPPAHTIEVPGGTQALQRTESVDVVVIHGSTGESRAGTVLRPTLIGAIITKAAATTITARANPRRDWQDAALLLSLLPDPFASAEDLKSKDRQRLSLLAPLDDRGHEGWANVDDESYRRGVAALSILRGPT